MRERLAVEFAGVIREVRENKWRPFSKAAKASKLDPYVALARMLVRVTEDVLGDQQRPEPSNN